MKRLPVTLSLSLGVGLLLASCGAVPAMPPELPESYIPEIQTEQPATDQGNLTPYGFSEAQRMAVRVRNITCTGVTRGTGFALDSNTLITNKHVVAGAKQLQLNTYDGRDVQVTSASVAGIADLALVRTQEQLDAYPVIAQSNPAIDEPVTVVGYPNGEALTVTSGTVKKYMHDPLNENLGEVIYSDAQVEHGSSGSAVLDSEGRLVGVVYAKNTSGASYIIPVSTLLAVQASGFQDQEQAECEQ